MSKAEKCVYCGDIIPEGRQVCPICERGTKMAINSKRKGASGERELVRKLKEYGFGTRRSVQYNGKAEEGQADLVGLQGIHIESKRVERLNVYDAIAQAKRDAKTDELPTVFHRKNNSKWLVTMELSAWMELYKAYFEELKEKENGTDNL